MLTYSEGAGFPNAVQSYDSLGGNSYRRGIGPNGHVL